MSIKFELEDLKTKVDRLVELQGASDSETGNLVNEIDNDLADVYKRVSDVCHLIYNGIEAGQNDLDPTPEQFRQIMERLGRMMGVSAPAPTAEVPMGMGGAPTMTDEPPVVEEISPAELVEFRQLIAVYMREKNGNDSEAIRDAKDSVDLKLTNNPALRSHLPPSIANDFR